MEISFFYQLIYVISALAFVFLFINTGNAKDLNHLNDSASSNHDIVTQTYQFIISLAPSIVAAFASFQIIKSVKDYFSEKQKNKLIELIKDQTKDDILEVKILIKNLHERLDSQEHYNNH